MGEAAQGELPQHVVFEKPFQVEPVYELWKTPENYREYPGGEKLGDKIKVWRVQKTTDESGDVSRRPGVVSRSWGFNDSPDAEVLAAGYNDGKENGAVAVGRHGNFLQWGFSAPPSKMTDAGRSFFLNCICYIVKFDGKGPLIRREFDDRIEGVRHVKRAATRWRDPSYARQYPPDIMKKYGNNPEGMFAHYMENYELIYLEDNVYTIDPELKSLGIPSNRRPETLEKLVALLRDPVKAETARKLLRRYTLEALEKPEEWEAWLAKNRDRIYFSDTGGYKFRVVPEGYLSGKLK